MKRYPGKFECCADQRLARVLYDASCEGWCSEECGEVSECGWFGLIWHRDHGYILSEDSDGFFYYERYDDQAELTDEWNRIEEETYPEEEEEEEE